MNIDDEIAKQELIKNGYLELIKAHKIKVNETSLIIRRLQTVKRHAIQLIGESPALNITSGEEKEIPFVDPAQLDIEEGITVKDLVTAINAPKMAEAALKVDGEVPSNDLHEF